MPDEADDNRSGMEHLQAAAREVIQASRSLLDAAEDLVDDPAAVQNMVATFTSLAQVAASRLRPEAHRSPRGEPEPEGDDDGPDDGPIERIRIS